MELAHMIIQFEICRGHVSLKTIRQERVGSVEVSPVDNSLTLGES